MTTTTIPEMTTTLSAPTRSARVRTHPTVHYAVRSIALSLRHSGFIIFTIAAPVGMYLLFGQIFGASDPVARTHIMASFAAYGAIGAALSAGTEMQLERRSGWFRQLMLTGLTPGGFLVGKVVAAMVLVLPAIVSVFAVAALATGVQLPASTWFLSAAGIWASASVMVLFGLVLALWLKAETVQAATTLVLLVLSAIGGLWLPFSWMPEALQAVARLTPTYWIGQFGRWPVQGFDFPAQGVAVLGAWVAVLVVLGVVGYRRAVANSSR